MTTQTPDLKALADAERLTQIAAEYEAGTAKCAASGYEEYGPKWQLDRKLMIHAMRFHAAALRAAPEASGTEPVAWKYRAIDHTGNQKHPQLRWVYSTDEPPDSQYYEKRPLFASPPPADMRGTEGKAMP